jgi:hypothetical protein
MGIGFLRTELVTSITPCVEKACEHKDQVCMLTSTSSPNPKYPTNPPTQLSPTAVAGEVEQLGATIALQGREEAAQLEAGVSRHIVVWAL